MAPRGSQKSSRWTDPDPKGNRPITSNEEGPKRLKPLSKALSKAKAGTTETESPSPPKKRNGRVKANDQSNPGGRPIQSFFNSAAQKQQSSQYVPNSEKLAPLHNEVETIQDCTDEDEAAEDSSQTTLSKGSSTALAARKRKFGAANNFERTNEPVRHASQKFQKTSNGERVTAAAKSHDISTPWTERFAPNDLSELAVHKRKVADVRKWLDLAYRERHQKVLILKGAAGTAKTTTLRLLARDIGIELIEWRESSASDNTSEGVIASVQRFADFVARAGNVQGLTLSTDKNAVAPAVESQPDIGQSSAAREHRQALLVEEFPNTFSKASSALQSFRTTLARYVMSTVEADAWPTPVVLVISETLLSTNTASADSFTAHRLLGPELTSNPNINTIEFNPIAPTILTKALEMIVVKEARKSGRRKTPGSDILKRLAECGDIRSAVSSLEFLCVRGDEGDTWSSKVAFTKPKHARAPAPTTKAEQDAMRLISNRESSLGIFHSVGKVVYNKRMDPIAGQPVAQPPPWLSHYNRTKASETDPNLLLDELGTDTTTFMAALHENYALSCASPTAEQRLDSLLGCMENLSDSDILSLDRFSFGTRAFSGSATDTLRQDEMCFQVAVRGLLFSLPHPVHRSEAGNGKRGDAHRMFYPASLRIWRRREEIESEFHAVIDQIASAAGLDHMKDATTTTSSTPSTGIETWKQNKFGKQPPKPSPHSNSPDSLLLETPLPKLSSQAKNEMLLDRLPYMAQILRATGKFTKQQQLRNQILSITQIKGNVLPGDDDADDSEDEDEEAAHDGGAAVEAWATDRPHAEDKSMSSKTAGSASRPVVVLQKKSIPVEKRVQSLVLEDDDIED